MKCTPTNEEIINKLREVIHVPEDMINMELKLTVNEAPQITFTKYAERVNNEKDNYDIGDSCDIKC